MALSQARCPNAVERPHVAMSSQARRETPGAGWTLSLGSTALIMAPCRSPELSSSARASRASPLLIAAQRLFGDAEVPAITAITSLSPYRT